MPFSWLLRLTQLPGFIYFATWNYAASTHFPSLAHVGPCAGDPYAAAMGCTVLTSYLFLFIFFYYDTYRRLGKASKCAAPKSMASLKKRQPSDALGIPEKSVRVQSVVTKILEEELVR